MMFVGEARLTNRAWRLRRGRDAGKMQPMNTSLEERVSALESKVQRLAQAIAPEAVWRDGWESTVGMSAKDPGFEEMVSLGAEYRRSVKRDADGADSGQ